MVTSYVTALNTPGTVPNVQKAWDVFVSTKCTQAKSDAVAVYDEAMRSEMSGRMPCERDIVRQAQLMALDETLKLFEEKTFGISTANIEKYLNELTVRQYRHNVEPLNVQNVLVLETATQRNKKL